MNQCIVRPGTLLILATALFTTSLFGCRSYQFGHLIRDNEEDMVGSHSAGGEVYKPLVEESVAKLLGACYVTPAAAVFTPDGMPLTQRVCFIGVENKSSEELGDFKDQIYQLIDTQINRADAFEAVSRRMMDAALIETGLRPDSLLVPANMQVFASALQQHGQPVDYLLYATLTSGTTQRNSSSQRDYLLTLEIVDTRTGAYKKEQAEISKGYHRSPLGKIANYGFFSGGH
ncbi:MAG: penicillin-binding protein activator LpoB [Planctomycetales bacterium]|nr:penicillin-binding protein activator LpoB [Planctomycetales bacterium]